MYIDIADRSVAAKHLFEAAKQRHMIPDSGTFEGLNPEARRRWEYLANIAAQSTPAPIIIEMTQICPYPVQGTSLSLQCDDNHHSVERAVQRFRSFLEHLVEEWQRNNGELYDQLSALAKKNGELEAAKHETSPALEPLRNDKADCTCGQLFRSAEDYRDHLPCAGDEKDQEISRLRRLVEAMTPSYQEGIREGRFLERKRLRGFLLADIDAELGAG